MRRCVLNGKYPWWGIPYEKGRGCLSNLLGVKKMVLVPLRVLNLLGHGVEKKHGRYCVVLDLGARKP